MPIKQKKSSREKGKPNELPHWDDREEAASSESADARIRRMSMQMTSAERSGFRGERSDLYGGLPPAAVWALRFTAAAVVIGGIFAATSFFTDRKSPTKKVSDSNDDAIAALIRAAGERPSEAISDLPESPTKDAFQWLSTAEESFSPFRETILSFFEASTPSERTALVIPIPDVEKRLKKIANDALFDQIAAPTFASNYCSGEGWMTVDVFLPSFGFRPIIIKTSSEENLIDLDAFLGHNPKPFIEIKEDLDKSLQKSFHALATLSPIPPETPGDILVVLRAPNDPIHLEEKIVARLSRFGSTPEYIIKWLEKSYPLPFTVTVTPETMLSGESTLRISEIYADAWSSGLTLTPVSLAPPSETISIDTE